MAVTAVNPTETLTGLRHQGVGLPFEIRTGDKDSFDMAGTRWAKFQGCQTAGATSSSVHRAGACLLQVVPV